MSRLPNAPFPFESVEMTEEPLTGGGSLLSSDPKQDTGETHAPVPLVISDRGYGIAAGRTGWRFGQKKLPI